MERESEETTHAYDWITMYTTFNAYSVEAEHLNEAMTAITLADRYRPESSAKMLARARKCCGTSPRFSATSPPRSNGNAWQRDAEGELATRRQGQYGLDARALPTQWQNRR